MTAPASGDGAPGHPAPRLYADLAGLWPLVSPPEHYVEEVATFRERFSRHGVEPGSRVLHLGCGGGSIDYHLKDLYDVTGIDLSEDMLAHARGLNPEVAYHVGDMRDHRLGEVFDGVLVHDAIAYMTSEEELAAVYATAAAHLRPGGVLIALPEEIPARVAAGPNSVETHAHDGGTVTFVDLIHDPDPADTVYDHVLVFVVWDEAGMRVEVDRHVCGVFELDVWVAAIEGAGFDATVEPWDLTEWQEDEVPLPLITAVRK